MPKAGGDQLARTIARRLRGGLAKQQKEKIAKQSTTNPDAYRSYVKALYSYDQWTQEDDFATFIPMGGP